MFLYQTLFLISERNFVFWQLGEPSGREKLHCQTRAPNDYQICERTKLLGHWSLMGCNIIRTHLSYASKKDGLETTTTNRIIISGLLLLMTCVIFGGLKLNGKRNISIKFLSRKTQTLKAIEMFMPTSLETISKNEIHIFPPFFKLFINFTCVILRSSQIIVLLQFFIT